MTEFIGMNGVVEGFRRFRRKGILLSLALLFGASLVSCGSRNTHLAYLGIPTSNGIAAFRIDNNTGKFTPIVGSPFLAGNSPGPVVVAPSNNFLYTANQTDNTISLFKIDRLVGALTEVTPRINTGLSPSAMVMNAAGSFLFVANTISHGISVYSVDASSGALTEVAGSPFLVPANPVSMAITPSGNFLYVVTPNITAVFGYSIASSGVLTQVPGEFAVGNGPSGIAIDPQGKFVHVANSSDNTLSILAINSSTGTLTSVPNSPFETGTTPISVTIDPTSSYLYIANEGSNNITGYTVDTNGVPTLITDQPFSGTTGPILITSDPDGKYVYVISQSNKSVATFNITTSTTNGGTLGTLTSAQSASVGQFPAISLALTSK